MSKQDALDSFLDRGLITHARHLEESMKIARENSVGDKLPVALRLADALPYGYELAREELRRLHAENGALQQKVYALESSEKALKAQLSTKELLVQSLRRDRLAHEAKMQKLADALAAGDGEAAAQILGGDQEKGVE